MERTATATWRGTLDNGRGEISSGSGALDSQAYSFGARFDDDRGTNPEELLGAAHAGCYSMALSQLLEERGIDSKRIDTEASVKLSSTDEGFAITEVHLHTRVEAPGADRDTFAAAVEDARSGCIVSEALDAEITLGATLVN